MFAALKKKETYQHYFKTLRYTFHVLTHPLDGFWDLTHEKRGSLAAANTIVALTVLAKLMTLQYTSFLFLHVYWPGINIFLYIASILFPLALWSIGNWALTTLFDGKGRLKQVYMATAYALAPMPLIQFPLIVLSNVVTAQEGAFYKVFNSISYAWVVILIIAAMMQIHEYSLSKAFFFCIATVFAIAVMIFLLLLFFNQINQVISYVVSIVKEILFRL